MKRLLIITILISILVLSCIEKNQGIPLSSAEASVPSGEDFAVTFLFEIDGVKLYRFIDGGRYRYFSTGNGSFQGQIQTEYNHQTKTTDSWIDGTASY